VNIEVSIVFLLFRSAFQLDEAKASSAERQGADIMREGPVPIQQSFDEENEMIAEHRKHIEGTMRLVRHEMGLLGKVGAYKQHVIILYQLLAYNSFRFAETWHK
jgi:hypothetical protein